MRVFLLKRVRICFVVLGAALIGGSALVASSVGLQTPVFTTIYSFAGPNADGASPEAPLAIGAGGVLYGTTFGGGPSYMGTVFELTPQTGGTYTETVLYSFTGKSSGDGYGPKAGLIITKAGVLYGTTEYGGIANSSCPSGCGIVFALTPPSVPGGAWTKSIVYSFTGRNGDGAFPLGGVVLGPGGVLYGTTSGGGSSGWWSGGPAGLGDGRPARREPGAPAKVPGG